MTDTSRLPRRRLRFFLRDFRMAEGLALMPDGLSLTSYLANRRGYLHLLELRWQPSNEGVDFAVLRTDHVLYAMAPAADIPLVNAMPAARPHGIELLAEGGLFLRGGLLLGPKQRLGDFLEAAGSFVPLLGVRLLRSGRPPRPCNIHWGDIVLNQGSIQAVWETQGWDPAEDGAPSEGHARVPGDEPIENEPA